jgi:hypothetical protein
MIMTFRNGLAIFLSLFLFISAGCASGLYEKPVKAFVDGQAGAQKLISDNLSAVVKVDRLALAEANISAPSNDFAHFACAGLDKFQQEQAALGVLKQYGGSIDSLSTSPKKELGPLWSSVIHFKSPSSPLAYRLPSKKAYGKCLDEVENLSALPPSFATENPAAIFAAYSTLVALSSALKTISIEVLEGVSDVQRSLALKKFIINNKDTIRDIMASKLLVEDKKLVVWCNKPDWVSRPICTQFNKKEDEFAFEFSSKCENSPLPICKDAQSQFIVFQNKVLASSQNTCVDKDPLCPPKLGETDIQKLNYVRGVCSEEGNELVPLCKSYKAAAAEAKTSIDAFCNKTTDNEAEILCAKVRAPKSRTALDGFFLRRKWAALRAPKYQFDKLITLRSDPIKYMEEVDKLNASFVDFDALRTQVPPANIAAAMMTAEEHLERLANGDWKLQESADAIMGFAARIGEIGKDASEVQKKAKEVGDAYNKIGN